MTASWRPALWVSCAFNAQPNDPAERPAWSDLSSPFFVAADNIMRGRQYELDQNQAAQPSFSFLDQSEYLNPANTSSPYYPGVVPMRELLFQAMWPNQATGNLLNANQGASSILGTTTAGYDPSFESYTVGTAVPWIDALGGTTPLVGNSTPHSGSQDLTWTVGTGSTTEQGAAWVVPCVPGQQYTESAYVRQSTASTQVIGVGGLTMAQDAFNRTTSGGWGSADIGGAWTTTGGSASDFSVTPGAANIEGTTVNVIRTVTVGSAAQDSDTIAFFQVDQIATGAAIRAAVCGRRTASNTMYLAQAQLATDASILFSISRVVAGVEAVVTSQTMTFPYAVDTLYGLRLTITGAQLSASMWQATDPPPTVPTLSNAETTITGTGTAGCYQKLAAGNTNTNPNVTFSTYSSLYTLAGTSTSTTGAYVRLTCTFTASQPTHTIQLAALSATAGTVLLDDVQHEQGASAGTFTTSGPTVYGVFRGFVERWPSQWLNGGFLGYCEATAVDAFEALNLFTLSSEYYSAVQATNPNYYWPLNDAAGTTSYGEQSGNGGPALVNYVSKYGGATAPAAGTSLNIVGDPGGTGVAFDSQTTSSSQVGTIIGVGQLVTGSQSAISWPRLSAASWSASIAVWVSTSIVKFSPADDQVLTWAPLPGPNPVDLTPLSIDIDSGGQMQVFYSGATTLSELFGAGPVLTDGLPHLLVGTVTQSAAGNTTVTAYVDGTQINTATVSTASLGGIYTTPSVTFMAGGFFSQGLFTQIVNGSLAHVALWNRVLSSAEVTALWDAGGLGNAGETSGTRVARYVASAWTESTNIDTGNAVMGVATVTTGTSVLDACQQVTVTEQGNFFADKDGQVTFVQRDVRYLNLTSRFTFGENVAGGEYPYQDDLEYDFDPTFVFGQVTVNNADGVTAVVSNSISQHEFFPRANTIEVDLLSDDQAAQTGYWQLNTHDQPIQRINSITLDPTGNPNLWPVVLSLEIGDRVTVIRRPKAANGGAGLTMTGDFFVENISHGGIDMSVQNATWKTTLLMSPAALTSNVFIFNDSTFGTFDGAFSRFAL